MSANTEPITGDGGALYHPDTDDFQTPAVADISTTGTAVTGGVGTVFQTEFPNFATTQPTFMIAAISDGTVEARLVTAVASETACTLGTAFSEDLPANSVYTYAECNKVPFVIEASGPDGRSRNAVDDSHLGTGSYDSSTPGSITPGTFSFPFHFVGSDAEHVELEARFNSGLVVPWLVFVKNATVPIAVPSLNNGRWYFRGYVQDNPGTIRRNETVKFSLTVAIKGQTIIEAGT